MGNIANKLPTDIKLHDVVTQQYFQGLSNNFPTSIQNLQDVIYYVTSTWYNEYFGLTDKEVNYPIVEDAVISITDTTNDIQNDIQVVVDIQNDIQNDIQVNTDTQIADDTTNDIQTVSNVKRYVVVDKINKNMLVENANVEINNEYDETEIKAILKNPDNLAKLIANAKIQEKILEVK